jgi:hypothetical protein
MPRRGGVVCTQRIASGSRASCSPSDKYSAMGCIVATGSSLSGLCPGGSSSACGTGSRGRRASGRLRRVLGCKLWLVATGTACGGCWCGRWCGRGSGRMAGCSATSSGGLAVRQKRTTLISTVGEDVPWIRIVRGGSAAVKSISPRPSNCSAPGWSRMTREIDLRGHRKRDTRGEAGFGETR